MPVGIYHADPDGIIAAWRPVLEIDLIAQDQPVGRVELKLIVIAKPMMFGSAGNRSNWRKPGRLLTRESLMKRRRSGKTDRCPQKRAAT